MPRAFLVIRVIWNYEEYYTALSPGRSNECYEHLEISRQHSDSNMAVFDFNGPVIAFTAQHLEDRAASMSLNYIVPLNYTMFT
jgi:hypothetical protein